jgi:hypothetical protein
VLVNAQIQKIKLHNDVCCDEMFVPLANQIIFVMLKLDELVHQMDWIGDNMLTHQWH